MKRRIAIILLLLIGGAIVNVAVAWGCAMYDDPDRASEVNRIGRTVKSDPFFEWRVTSTTVYGMTSVQSIAAGTRFGTPPPELEHGTAEAILPRWATNLRPSLPPSEPDIFARQAVANGLPFRSLVRMYDLDNSVLGLKPLQVVTAPLPMHPLLPGFIINTLFYAVILWLLFITPFIIQRKVRRKRGQCETCAYPIGVSPVCTECGAALPQRGAAEA